MLACSLCIMGGLMLTIVLMRRNINKKINLQEKNEENITPYTTKAEMEGQKLKKRQEELVQKYEKGTITTEEAAELAKNPPYREDQTIEYEINRYGPDFRPRAAELVEQYRNGEIDYMTFITELGILRTMAMKAKQYEV